MNLVVLYAIAFPPKDLGQNSWPIAGVSNGSLSPCDSTKVDPQCLAAAESDVISEQDSVLRYELMPWVLRHYCTASAFESGAQHSDVSAALEL